MSKPERGRDGRVITPDVKLDVMGNIDTEHLSKELRDALDFDIKYKQTDNMKKRAIRTAGSYDDFKGMVACAHLKTLNRGEVESLRDIKRGWQKSNPVGSSITANILSKEVHKQNDLVKGAIISDTIISTTLFKKPKTPMELERDWRRLKNDENKAKYLKDVGLKKFTKLFHTEGNAELFENILFIIMMVTKNHSEDQLKYMIKNMKKSKPKIEILPQTPLRSYPQGGAVPPITPVTPPSSPSKETSSPSSPTTIDNTIIDLSNKDDDDDIVDKPNSIDSFKWLKSISLFEKFDLLKHFISSELRTDIINYLQNLHNNEDLKEYQFDEIINTIMKSYSC